MNAKVYEETLATGSLWLRSDQYYREIEDASRRDECEGVNAARLGVPLRFSVQNTTIAVQGCGQVGQQIRPHYILSLHGSSIFKSQVDAFGGHTIGIRSLRKLSAEILYRCSLAEIKCDGYRFGPVSYQRPVLALSQVQWSGAAICLGGQPSTYLNPLDTDVLRKEPIAPFTEQDEWRVVIFTDGYLDGDPNSPLKINVEPSHFYPYQGCEV